MFNPFPIKFKFILLICLTAIFGFCFPTYTQAQLAPGIFVTELKINEIKDNEIRGEFRVWNSEKYYLADLNYEIKLFQGISFEEQKLIDVEIPKETFFVPPNETITKSFTYRYPKNIISGDYTLRAQIITERGSELGWKDEIISLKGENKFLEIFTLLSKLLVKEEEVPPLVGIKVSSEEDVTARFKVKNPGEEITVIPKIKVFKRQFNMPLVKEYEDSPITFSKEETKEITLEMPKFDIPESYLAEVKLHQDNEQVSGIQYFRWVIEGEGGKVLYVEANKDYYKAGENIELIIESIGPPDLSDIGEGKLEITVFDRDGNLIAKTSKDVFLSSDMFSLEIAIPVEKDLISPRIEVKLIKNENILDERKIELPIFSAQAKQLEKEIEREKIKKYLLYSLSTLIIILIIGFLIFKFRKRFTRLNKPLA